MARFPGVGTPWALRNPSTRISPAVGRRRIWTKAPCSSGREGRPRDEGDPSEVATRPDLRGWATRNLRLDDRAGLWGRLGEATLARIGGDNYPGPLEGGTSGNQLATCNLPSRGRGRGVGRAVGIGRTRVWVKKVPGARPD